MNPQTAPTNRPPVMPSNNVAPALRPNRNQGVTDDLLEPGEQVVTFIRRHPIGIIGYYLEGLLALIVLIGFGAFMVNVLGGGINHQTTSYLIGIIVFSLAVVVFFLFVATYVYRQCRIIVTDRSLIQILQKSLFIRKVSRLSLTNVEDVSAESRGILASMFGYGTLVVQTAGTLENFEFPYCPTPTIYADQIIEARQRYAETLQESMEHLPPQPVSNLPPPPSVPPQPLPPSQ